MGSCTSNNSSVDEKDQTLSKNDVEVIRNSWKLVVKTGLGVYGTNMMIM
jgi:hypothetical protein